MGVALSRREREVADLVAEGLTSHEIAERLVISDRTAEGHVEQIRNKLGVRSRAQVAAWVVAQRADAAAHRRASSDVSAAAVALPQRKLVRPALRLSRGVLAAVLAAVLVVAAVALWPRAISPSLVLVAGFGSNGFSGDGGPAVAAQLSDPTSLAFDGEGGLIFADSFGPSGGGGAGATTFRTRIRRIGPSGTIHTIVGEPALYPFEAADRGMNLALDREARIAVGPQGEIYIAVGYQSERSGHWVGRIDEDGRFTWLAGGVVNRGVPPRGSALLYPRGLAVGPSGVLNVSDSGNNRILAIPRAGEVLAVAGTGQAGATGDDGPALLATFRAPLAIASSPDGSLHIADTNNQRIRAIDHGGTVVNVAGDGTQGYSGDGGPATRARLSMPSDLAFGPGGVLYVLDAGNTRVRAIARDGTITTVAGPEGLVRPTAIAVDPAGTLFIGDAGAHRIYKLTR